MLVKRPSVCVLASTVHFLFNIPFKHVFVRYLYHAVSISGPASRIIRISIPRVVRHDQGSA
jgi:hypothetical protein